MYSMCDMSTGVFQLIKTAIAQILVAKETQGESAGWSCLGCGAMCLIKDESIRSYFLRLYCVKVRWTAELITDTPPSHICCWHTTSVNDVTF